MATTSGMSVDMVAAPERDKELRRLEDMKRKLEEERQAFSEATAQLNRERAELQVLFSDPAWFNS